jgi:hydroxyethylthiazole kinase-like uncharacterized protein yjeF
MKLITRVTLRLAIVLLPIMIIWGMVFYFSIVTEINDETDDSLEDYAEMLVRRTLAGKELPMPGNGSNNTYYIEPLPGDTHYETTFSFKDRRVYIHEEKETEPARELTMIFFDKANNAYRLVVSTPTFEREDLLPLLTARRRHSHKGDYGRALLVAGSLGMAGASVLAARAAMRSGVGLLTLHVPRCNNTIVQTTLPEAMTSLDICDTHITSLPSVGRFNAVAVGPGLGTDESTAVALLQLMDCNVPVVMDADALNILSMHPDWFYKIPAGSVITPHPGEFARLTGCATGGYEALQRARDFAERYKVCVVLKGAYTAVISPNGDCSFNHCGNAGMATGGSGDVLTGILLALLAQGHTAYDAARLAVYIHGKAGNEAAAAKGMRSMIAGDIVEALPSAWLSLEKDLQYWNSDF